MHGLSSSEKDVLSWVLSVLLQIAASSLTAESKAVTKLTTAPGDAGSASAPKADVVLTFSSLSYPRSNANFSSDPSLPVFAQPNGQKEAARLMATVSSQWSRALCAKPQATQPGYGV
jgi:hypothetical protein